MNLLSKGLALVGGLFSESNITVAGFLVESNTPAITAFAGGGQAGATQIATEVANVTTVVTSGDSVKLPVAAAGLTIHIINSATKPIQVFGAGTDTINGVATAVGVNQMPFSVVHYVCSVTGTWQTNGLGTGFSGSLPTVSFKDLITAFAGGGQASATLLTTLLNRVTVVATVNDSVKLLPASGGISGLVVTNASANALAIFPATGDQINGAGVNVVFTLATGKTATFNAMGTLNWHAVLSA